MAGGRRPALAAVVTPLEPGGRRFGPELSPSAAGSRGSGFDETAEALFLTQGYVYESAAQAEAAFAGEVDHYIYSRYGNPSVRAFEERLRLIEGAEACFATATGMAAVFTVARGVPARRGPRRRRRARSSARASSSSTSCCRGGASAVFVDGHDLAQWEKALATPAQGVFFESPSNPMQDLVDVAAVCELAHAAGARVVVDNVFATPLLQKPFALGADVVVYSATKHIDGQGRVLGGAILGPKDYVDGDVQTLMRHTGPSMSPFNAWVLLKGLETLRLRVDHQCAVAARLARWLEAHPRVRSVRYPFLPSTPSTSWPGGRWRPAARS